MAGSMPVGLTSMPTTCKNPRGGRLLALLSTVLLVSVLFPAVLSAQTQKPLPAQALTVMYAEAGDKNPYVAMLTPLVAIVVTYLVRKVTGFGSWALPVTAAIAGVGYHEVTAYMGSHASNPLLGLLLGLAGVGLHQIKAQLTPPDPHDVQGAPGPTFKP